MVTVVGGTGLIGTKIVKRMIADGHDVVSASRSTGCQLLHRRGPPRGAGGAEVVIDASNMTYVRRGRARSTSSTRLDPQPAGLRRPPRGSPITSRSRSSAPIVSPRAKVGISSAKHVQENADPRIRDGDTRSCMPRSSTSSPTSIADQLDGSGRRPCCRTPSSSRSPRMTWRRRSPAPPLGPPLNKTVRVRRTGSVPTRRARATPRSRLRDDPRQVVADPARAISVQRSTSANCCPATTSPSPRHDFADWLRRNRVEHGVGRTGLEPVTEGL